jgi:hypothetical protein
MGFGFRERMHGKLHMLAEPLATRDVRLEIEAHMRDVRGGIATVVGRIDADGLASNATVQGTLALRSLHERRIPYDLHFTGLTAGGEHLRLVGEKDLSWLAPIDTLATLPFTIVMGEGTWKEIARGTLRVDVRHDWRSLVRSFRVSPF